MFKCFNHLANAASNLCESIEVGTNVILKATKTTERAVDLVNNNINESIENAKASAEAEQQRQEELEAKALQEAMAKANKK